MMAACVRCGAETMLFVNEVPLCIECDAKNDSENSERDRLGGGWLPVQPPKKHELIAAYTKATKQYVARVKDLARATGGMELDAYLNLVAKCEESRVLCISLRDQIDHLRKNWARAA